MSTGAGGSQDNLLLRGGPPSFWTKKEVFITVASGLSIFLFTIVVITLASVYSLPPGYVPPLPTTSRPSTTSTIPTTTKKATSSAESSKTTNATEATSATTPMAEDTTTSLPPPFHPTTRKPLPHNATDLNPATLLHQMGMHPRFTHIPCEHTQPMTYRYQVHVQEHDYFGEASTRHDAKTAAAMAACEAFFDLQYPKQIDPPKYPCVPKETEIEEIPVPSYNFHLY